LYTRFEELGILEHGHGPVFIPSQIPY